MKRSVLAAGAFALGANVILNGGWLLRALASPRPGTAMLATLERELSEFVLDMRDPAR